MAGSLHIAATQHIGSRKEQQDAWDSRQVGAVVIAAMADGMGGMADGLQASSTAIQTALSWCAENTAPLLQRLVRAQQEASDAVRREAIERNLAGSMGSTLLLAAVEDGKLIWSSTGDSRIYLVRQGRPLQLTRDHTFGAQHVRQAAAESRPPEDIKDSERRKLTSWMGVDDLREIDSSEEPLQLQDCDCVLLMSDGCYDALPDIIPMTENPENLGEMLVDIALSRNLAWQDNVTCVVLQWLEK